MTSQKDVPAGDYYLVDLGELTYVPASSPSAALHVANTSVFLPNQEIPCWVRPRVYQLAPDGGIVAVYQ